MSRRQFGPDECLAPIGDRIVGEQEVLQIVQQFKRAYESRLQQIEDEAGGGDCLPGLQAKVSLQQEWIRDLTELLVRVVLRLEQEDSSRVPMLEQKLEMSVRKGSEVGPRKYKRRRNLKPHELEMMTSRANDDEDEDHLTDSEEDHEYKRKIVKKPKKTPPKPNLDESYADVDNSFTSAIIENITSMINSQLNMMKMIHTQKTRVPVEINDGSKVVETDMPVPTNIIKVTTTSSKNYKKKSYSLRPGRTIIGPGSKVVRLVKGGMIVSKNKKVKEKPEPEPENITPDFMPKQCIVKQEIIDPSPLHELAELSVQHAQNIFKCEMCSEVFSDRDQLLVHVPIHI